MADLVKSRREGDRVYFVINRYISPTNICVLSCAFCGFARKKGEDGAFEYTIEDIVGMVGEEVREVHIVGGHHPDWPFEYYERVIAALRAARPEVQIKAFTAAEIDYFWRRRPASSGARRRRRDLLGARGEAPALRGQGGPGALVRDPRDRARARHQDQRDDALRPRRDARRTRRPSPAPPGAAGRLGRIPHVHSPAVPGGNDPARASADAAHR